jgi:beta-lactamase class D
MVDEVSDDELLRIAKSSQPQETENHQRMGDMEDPLEKARDWYRSNLERGVPAQNLTGQMKKKGYSDSQIASITGKKNWFCKGLHLEPPTQLGG